MNDIIDKDSTKRSISTLKGNKKIIYLMVSLLVITIVFLGIFINNVKINNENDTEAYVFKSMAEEKKEIVEEKREQYLEYQNMPYYSNVFRDEYKNALLEAQSASEAYLRTCDNQFNHKPTVEFFILTITFGIPAVVLLFLIIYASEMNIIITKEKIYGKKGFGHDFSFNIKDVSMVNKSFLNGITINGGQCTVSLILLNNIQEIYSDITDLMK